MGFDDDNSKAMECQMCSHVGLQESDGFYYCQACCAQAVGLMDTGDAGEVFVDKGGEGGGGPRYSKAHSHPETLPLSPPSTNLPLFGPAPKNKKMQQQQLTTTTTIAANNNYNNSGNHSSIRREPYYNYGSYNDDGLGPAEPEDFGSAAVAKLGERGLL